MVVTAVLAFVFGHWKGIQERRAQNRTEAYTQLIQAIAGLAQAQKTADATATSEAQGAFEEARLRLAVYGTAKVARAFARFLVAAVVIFGCCRRHPRRHSHHAETPRLLSARPHTRTHVPCRIDLPEHPS